MAKTSKRQQSKRQTLRKKFAIQRHVKEHHRDVRKAIKLRKRELGKRPNEFKAERAVLSVPMKDSGKEELLRMALAARAEGKLQKKSKKPKEATDLGEAAAQNRRLALSKKKKELEDGDFVLQLAKALELANLFVHIVDARAPTAGLSENLTLAAELHKLPQLILLTKHDLIPEEVLTAQIAYLKKSTKAFDVIPYEPTVLVACIQKKFGMGNKVYGVLGGLPNAGIRTMVKNLIELQGGRVSVHPSKEVARGRIPHSKEIAFMTLPQEATFISQPICGLDCLYRSWQHIANNLKDLELHAEEVLRHFDPKTICKHFRMALCEDTSPTGLLAALTKRRSMADVRDAARLLLLDFNQGALQWCCVPPSTTHVREGWTVIDEAFLSTQDYSVIAP